jgi:hypothetical protein
VARRVDQIDQETFLALVTLVRVRDEYQILIIQFKEHRDGSASNHLH